MGLILTAVPFIYVAIGVFYGPVAVIARVRSFLKFRKNDDGVRPEAPERRTEADPNANLYSYMRPGPEYNYYHGSSAGQIFGNLAAGAVVLIALMSLTLLFGGGEAFLFAALGAYIIPAFAFSFDIASIWGKRRTKAENQALVDGVTGVRVRYVILGLSWAIGIVGSYWLATWFFIAGNMNSIY
jgi:hypothetical protein